MWRFFLLVVVMLSAWVSPTQAAECPALLQGDLPKLRSEERIDLCATFSGKPLLVINTASFCGFTPQFKGLEALYQRYQAQGLQVLGVPSDDFRQEADSSAETAKVCYVNYGVTFPMSETQAVSGADRPVIRHPRTDSCRAFTHRPAVESNAALSATRKSESASMRRVISCSTLDTGSNIDTRAESPVLGSRLSISGSGDIMGTNTG